MTTSHCHLVHFTATPWPSLQNTPFQDIQKAETFAAPQCYAEETFSFRRVLLTEALQDFGHRLIAPEGLNAANMLGSHVRALERDATESPAVLQHGRKHVQHIDPTSGRRPATMSTASSVTWKTSPQSDNMRQHAATLLASPVPLGSGQAPGLLPAARRPALHLPLAMASRLTLGDFHIFDVAKGAETQTRSCEHEPCLLHCSSTIAAVSNTAK